MRTVQECNRAIAQIKITGKGLDEAVQSVGLDVIQHVETHGEVSLAIKLLNALPKGARAKALADWFTKYGKVAVNLDKATSKQFPLIFDRDAKTDLEGATAKPWYRCKKDRPLSEEFDFAGQLSALLKRAAEAEKAGKTIKGAEKLAELRGVKPEVQDAE